MSNVTGTAGRKDSQSNRGLTIFESGNQRIGCLPVCIFVIINFSTQGQIAIVTAEVVWIRENRSIFDFLPCCLIILPLLARKDCTCIKPPLNANQGTCIRQIRIIIRFQLSVNSHSSLRSGGIIIRIPMLPPVDHIRGRGCPAHLRITTPSFRRIIPAAVFADPMGPEFLCFGPGGGVGECTENGEAKSGAFHTERMWGKEAGVARAHDAEHTAFSRRSQAGNSVKP